HPLPGIIHVNRIEKEMILLSRHQLVEIHEQEPIMVRGDGSQHFVELIDMVEMFIRRVGHCRENDFDLARTSYIDDGFDVTSKDPKLTRIQRTLRFFPADLRGGFYEHPLRAGVKVKLQRPVGNAYSEDVSIPNPRRLKDLQIMRIVTSKLRLGDTRVLIVCSLENDNIVRGK